VIPRIRHSRSQLVSHINEYDDGAISFFVLADTYPDLFDLSCSAIANNSPTGWKTSKSGKMKYLWFPSVDEEDIETITEWKEKFEQYVLLGLNQHIEDHFNDELDFCMALDFNFTPGEGRTIYGEAEYQLKYKESRKHIKVLKDGLIEAIGDLPIPASESGELLVSYVPAKAGGCVVPRKLAKRIAQELELDLCKAVLTCPKSGLKGVSVDQKIPIWQELYDDDCVELSESVDGRTVLIIDDLYQSGATMWMYATHLKQLGAKYVFGLPCVKSLRDTDNQ